LKEQSCAPAAEQVTVVVPTGKIVPEAGEHVTGPQAPAAVGCVKVTAVPLAIGQEAAAATVWSARQVIAQGTTVTVKVQEAVLPEVSVAVQVTVVVPSRKQVPDDGEQEAVAPGQLSVGVGVV